MGFHSPEHLLSIHNNVCCAMLMTKRDGYCYGLNHILHKGTGVLIPSTHECDCVCYSSGCCDKVLYISYSFITV